METIRVRDYMVTKVLTVTPKTEILRAAHRMLIHDISGMPVVDEAGKLVGMLTERDYMRVVLEAGYYKDYGGRVENYMTKTVETIDPDESIMEVAKRFMDGPYRRYPVVENGQLIGQISRREVMRVLDKLW